MWTMTGKFGTSLAMRITERICATVPGLNAMLVMPISDNLVDEGNSLFEFRDTGRDDDTVDGSTGGTGTLHKALATELQLPQVRVEEQGVELDRTARLEQHLQLCDTVFEDFLGDLSATGELSPVTGIGCRGNDLGVDRRRPSCLRAGWVNDRSAS